jgi:hypothetical protein
MMVRTKMLRWLIFGLAVSLLILMLPGTILPHDGDKGTLVTTGGYQVSLVFPEPVKVGRNPVNLKILDETGLPVSGARVEISNKPVKIMQDPQVSMASGAHTHMMGGMHGMNHAMHNMQDMPGMNAAPTVARSRGLNRMPGDYFEVITFSAPGQWTLNTHSSINGQTFDANFPVNVAASHSASLTILAVFAGLNVLIIWAASVSKRKPVIAGPIGKLI